MIRLPPKPYFPLQSEVYEGELVSLIRDTPKETKCDKIYCLELNFYDIIGPTVYLLTIYLYLLGPTVYLLVFTCICLV